MDTIIKKLETIGFHPRHSCLYEKDIYVQDGFRFRIEFHIYLPIDCRISVCFFNYESSHFTNCIYLIEDKRMPIEADAEDFLQKCLDESVELMSKATIKISEAAMTFA